MSGSIAALFKRLTQGVYVVGVAHGEERDAFTAAWVADMVREASRGLPQPITISPARRTCARTCVRCWTTWA
jgi:hypothetical protein